MEGKRDMFGDTFHRWIEVNFSVPAAEHKNNVAALQCPCLRLPAFPFLAFVIL